MRRAILVMATSVAFLVSGAAFAVTGSRTATVTSAADLVTKGTLTNAAGELIVESAKSGLYIPAGASASTEVAIATKTVGTVAKAAVSTAVKAAVRANGAVIAVNGAIAAATAAVDWIQKDGSYVKKSSESTPTGKPWSGPGYPNTGLASTAQEACDIQGNYALNRYNTYISSTVQITNNGLGASCTPTLEDSSGNRFVGSEFSVSRDVSCPSGSSLDTASGNCMTTSSGTRPLTESDYNDLGDWVQQQDGTFVRQAAIEGCYLAASPDSCFESVVPDRKLTGPSIVTGTPSTTSKTVTTTDASGNVTSGTSTTTTTPAAKVTYNNNTTNNVTYNTYNQTTTKNPDGSETETTTDEGTPDVPDWLTPSLKPLQDLPDMIKGQGSEGNTVPYTSWFDLGGGKCSEIVLEVPVVGTVRSTFCDMYYKYVHPALYFLFAVWTWHTCFQIFRESATRVRAK